MTQLKRTITALAFLSLPVGLLASRRQDEPASSRVERGRYLVSVIGCGDCHTPKKMGPQGHFCPGQIKPRRNRTNCILTDTSKCCLHIMQDWQQRAFAPFVSRHNIHKQISLRHRQPARQLDQAA